ncbi:hypothetical protein D3C78_1048720 [compost metagenome]
MADHNLKIVRVTLHQRQLHIRGGKSVIHLANQRMQLRLQLRRLKLGCIQQHEAFNRIKAETDKGLIKKAFPADNSQLNPGIRALLPQQLNGTLGYHRVSRHGIDKSCGRLGVCVP